jgi:putative cardiolipin synthase
MNIGRRRERGLKVLGFLVVILIVGYFIMSFFYCLPDISSRRQSYMIDDGEATTLGQEWGPQTAAHPGKTGVFLLPNGRDAFAARALLARASEKSLDIQYYMYHHGCGTHGSGAEVD